MKRERKAEVITELSARQERVEVGGNRKFKWDLLAKGLVLVTYPDRDVKGKILPGEKSWMVCRWLKGKFTKFKFGSFPAFGVKAAREEAKVHIGAFERDEHPGDVKKVQEESQKAKEAKTVAVIGEDWLRLDQAELRTYEEVARDFRKHVIPILGSKPISNVTKEDCLTFIESLPKKTQSNRIFAYLHRFFKWAAGRPNLLTINPMIGISKPTIERARDRHLSNLEIKLFWEATETMGYPFGPCLQLLCLTGARENEIASLKWDEVKGDRIELPRERVKRNPKQKANGRDIPLSVKAREILKSIPEKYDFVFSTTGTSPISGFSRAKNRLDKLMQAGLLKEDKKLKPWHIHDLRHSVSSTLGNYFDDPKKASLIGVEILLGHVLGGMFARYNHTNFFMEAAKAAETWWTHIDNVLNGRIKGEGKVLEMPLKKRKSA